MGIDDRGVLQILDEFFPGRDIAFELELDTRPVRKDPVDLFMREDFRFVCLRFDDKRHGMCFVLCIGPGCYDSRFSGRELSIQNRCRYADTLLTAGLSDLMES